MANMDSVGRDTLRGIQAVEAKELQGPIALAGLHVQFPAACLGNLLSVGQERFAFTEAELGGFATGNIAGHQANRGRALGATSNRVSQCMEPAATGG